MIHVIGDSILDEFWNGTSTRLSPEAPVPVIEDIHKTRAAGGAANVALNLRSLGSQYQLLSAVGDDEAGTSLRDMVPGSIWATANEGTVHKTRIYTNGQCVARIDIDPPQPEVAWPWVTTQDDFIILSDYNKGTIRDTTTHIKFSQAKVLVDPKKPFHNYAGAWAIKPNWKEYLQFVGKGTSLVSEARASLAANSIEVMLVTAGPAGIFVITPDDYFHVPAKPVDVVDITGAGDTVLSAFTHHYSIHRDLRGAVEFGVEMAAQVIATHGTAVPHSVREKVIFTNGCFDILHLGHIELFKYAKSLGTKLVVGLNSDRSVKALKGASRPSQPQEARKAILESIGCVDEVIIFDEDTPINLIQNVKPDIIVKGGDYKSADVVGAGYAPVVIFPTVGTYSTTSILKGNSPE